MTNPMWVDPTDPLIFSTVTTGCPDEDAPVTADDPNYLNALTVASEVLTRLTGFAIHGPGWAVDDFMPRPSTRRLSPNFLPVREVLRVDILNSNCTYSDEHPPWCLVGHSLFFDDARCAWSEYVRYYCGCSPQQGQTLRVNYRFGGTVTASASAALCEFAHQLYLLCTDASACQLPERITSVSREGLSYTVIDPQEFLALGRTGLPNVDRWLRSVNPSAALRPSGVFTPDSPPPVNIAVFDAEPVVTP